MKTQDNIDQVSDSNESNTEKNNTNENRGDLQGTHLCTGTPPLTLFSETLKNRVSRKPCC